MPDDHSKLVPLLPIPNRTVKRLCADDSADSRVKVGHRQALTMTFAQLKDQLGALSKTVNLVFLFKFDKNNLNKKSQKYQPGIKNRYII